MTPLELLNSSRDTRIKVLFEKLEAHKDKLKKPFVFNNLLVNTPLVNNNDKPHLSKYLIKLPINYKSSKSYKYSVDNTIYELYKNNNCYFLMEVCNTEYITQDWLDDFMCSIYFSLVFYYVYNIVENITRRGIHLNLVDMTFNPLLSKFNTGNDLTLTISMLPVKNKIIKSDQLYISLFGDLIKVS